MDLFAGCGGMTLGLWEAARRSGKRMIVSLAVDSDPAILSVFRHNFTSARVTASDVVDILDTLETAADGGTLRTQIGPTLDLLVGGPPCQGHSDLNNHTRRQDPKNALYLAMGRAATILKPKIVVIENVVSVQRDRGSVVEATKDILARSDYNCDSAVVDVSRLGVPQRRKRFILIASRVASVHPGSVLKEILESPPCPDLRDVRWAISDLATAESKDIFDSASRPAEANLRRIEYLFENDLYDLPDSRRPSCHREKTHSYVSMYGRLRWDKPSQTITTGYGSMGQGRFVHPGLRRTITPHEAARLQTFPDWFTFEPLRYRSQLAKAIGNAVPPLMMTAIGISILKRLS